MELRYNFHFNIKFKQFFSIILIAIFLSVTFIPVKRAQAFELTADEVMMGAGSAPVLLAAASPFIVPAAIIGGALVVGGLVYTHREQIAIEGQRFINWASANGQNISSWWNSNGSITVNDTFRSQVSNFVSSEISSSSFYPSYSVSSSMPISRSYDSSTGNYTVSFSASIMPAGTYRLFRDSTIKNITFWDVIGYYLSTGGYSIGNPCTVVYTPTNSYPNPILNIGDNRISYSLSKVSIVSSVYLPDNYSLPLTDSVSYSPSAVASTATSANIQSASVAYPTDTVFNPQQDGFTVDDVVSQDGVSPVVLPATVAQVPYQPPTNGSTPDFTGIFGWLAKILAAILAIPTAVGLVKDAVLNLPTTIHDKFTSMFDGITQSISALPQNFEGLFNTIGDDILGLPQTVYNNFQDVLTHIRDGTTSIGTSMQDVITGIRDIPGSIVNKVQDVITTVQDGYTSVVNKISDVIGSVEAIPNAITSWFNVDWSVVSTHMDYSPIFQLKFKPFYDLTTELENISASPSQNGKVYAVIPTAMGGDGQSHVVLDLTAGGSIISYARTFLQYAIWMAFAWFIIKKFEPDLHIG